MNPPDVLYEGASAIADDSTKTTSQPSLFRGLLPETPEPIDVPVGRSLPMALWMCGLLSPAVYVATDIVAARRYPGFSYADQAVSELFAIESPTSRFVVPLFTLSSSLLLAFGLGLCAFGSRRVMRLLGIAFTLSAIDALVLWNFFPMHMRGDVRSFTDTMHLVLAANPFVLLSLVAGTVAARSWFRGYTIATCLIIVGLAIFGFSYAPAIADDGPTPWMGLSERIAQYMYGAWQAVLALALARSPHAPVSVPSRLR